MKIDFSNPAIIAITLLSILAIALVIMAFHYFKQGKRAKNEYLSRYTPDIEDFEKHYQD